MTQPQIAIPVGLFKAGLSGAGGDITPLIKIRRDIFQLTNMLYGLQMTGAFAGQNPAKTIIIDLDFDGYTMQDPHSSRPMSFVTNDTGKTGFWLGTFKAPNANVYGEKEYAALGKHKVKISVAPRIAPLTQMNMTIVVPVDGATKKVQTTTTTKVPVYGPPDCNGKRAITGYKDEVTVSEMTVPMETEITYEGYSVTQIIPPRDFSPEAGGVTREFEFEIFSSSLPPYDLPTED